MVVQKVNHHSDEVGSLESIDVMTVMLSWWKKPLNTMVYDYLLKTVCQSVSLVIFSKCSTLSAFTLY